MSRPNAFDGMMHEICVGLGWCGTVKNGQVLHVTELIPENGQVTADEFATWVVQSDGIDPDAVTRGQMNRWLQQLKAVFVKHMGDEVVDARLLRFGSGGS